jgi:two-component system, NarL family, sensor kinase
VERHAQASTVQLTLTRDERTLTLAIADDGRGFDVEALQRSPRAGLGLTHMRERVEALGGRFELSASSQGTRVAAAFAQAALAA